MEEKFHKLFGIKLGFRTGFSFALPLALINAFIIITFLELKEFEGFVVSLIMLIIETVIYLGWRYYRTKRLK